jgi:hypothetical protein
MKRTTLSNNNNSLIEKTNKPQLESKPLDEIQLSQTLQSLWMPGAIDDERNKQLLSMASAMHSIAPKDAVEEMIGSQLIAGHNATMRCFSEAMNANHSVEVRNSLLGTGSKLMRAYASLVDSLNRHRGKITEQRMTVIHVADGGKAIIGDVVR